MINTVVTLICVMLYYKGKYNLLQMANTVLTLICVMLWYVYVASYDIL